MSLERGSRYVAMGSSFAAGSGIAPRAEGSPRPAGRSSRNYARLLAADLALDLMDVTFSGATTADLLASNHPGRPAQLDAVELSTRLVTVTAGGNDVGYLPGLISASLPGLLGSLPAFRRVLASAIDPTTMDARFDALESSLGLVVDGIRSRAPEAEIILVSYLTILPEDTSIRTQPPGPKLAVWGRDVASRLADVTRRVAQSHDATYLDVAGASRAHHAWSAEPWTRRFHLTLRGGAAYHPNAAGMRAVASLLRDHLEGK